MNKMRKGRSAQKENALKATCLSTRMKTVIHTTATSTREEIIMDSNVSNVKSSDNTHSGITTATSVLKTGVRNVMSKSMD